MTKNVLVSLPDRETRGRTWIVSYIMCNDDWNERLFEISVRDCSLTISRADRTRFSIESGDFASERTLVRPHPVFRPLNHVVSI
jgi:hypothetical protein